MRGNLYWLIRNLLVTPEVLPFIIWVVSAANTISRVLMSIFTVATVFEYAFVTNYVVIIVHILFSVIVLLIYKENLFPCSVYLLTCC